MRTSGAIFAVAVSLVGGALAYTYLKIENFQVAGDKSKLETSVNKLLDGQAEIGARLRRLETDYDYQQTAIDNLSRKISDVRRTTLFEQTVVGLCLNRPDRRKIEYCSQIGGANFDGEK
jgi:flagellin-like hook-associated protein FlgL